MEDAKIFGIVGFTVGFANSVLSSQALIIIITILRDHF